MVQPQPEEPPGALPRIYDLGCLGRMASFSETEDGRLLITLVGVCRFRIQRELALATGGYRQAEVTYAPFHPDMDDPGDAALVIDRKRLLACLKPYLLQQRITLNWKILGNFSDAALITAAAMLCPFAVREKQALLEVSTVEERGKLLIALIEMGLLETGSGGIVQQ